MHLRESSQDTKFIHRHIGMPIYGKDSYKKTLKQARFPLMKTFGFISFFTGVAFGLGTLLNPPPLFADPYLSGSSLAAGEAQPESFESYQMRILRSQNQLQAEKIQTLRTELLEINQKLNELKPHLFKHGDPENEAKIGELNHQLAQQEQAIEKLANEKAYIQAELESNQKKMKEMETVKEALTAMVEAQRQAKEQNLAHFMKQLEEIHTTAENHKTELFNKILEHESHSEKLAQQVANKEQTIRRLDALAAQLNHLISKKDTELQQVKEHLLSLYDEHLSLAEHEGEKNAGFTQLQAEHAAKKQELEHRNNAYDLLQVEMYGHLHQLISSLSLEREQTKQIEQDLITLYNHHEGDRAASEALRNELQQTLNDLQNQKQTEASLLRDVEDLQEEIALREQIRQLALITNSIWIASRDFEINQIQQEQADLHEILSGFIQELTAALKDERALSTHLSTLLEDYVNSPELSSQKKFSAQLEELQQQHETIQNRLEDEKTTLEKKLFTLNQEIENKTQRLSHFEKEIEDISILYQIAHDRSLGLEEKTDRLSQDLEERTRSHSLLEENSALLSQNLLETTQALSLLEDKTGRLSQELEERTRSHSLLEENSALLSQNLLETTQALSLLEEKTALLSQELEERTHSHSILEENSALLSQNLLETTQALSLLEEKTTLLSQELEERTHSHSLLEENSALLSQNLLETTQALSLLEEKTALLSQDLEERTHSHSLLEEKSALLLQDFLDTTQALGILGEKTAILSNELEERNQAYSLLEGKIATLDFHNQSLSVENQDLQEEKDNFLKQIQTDERNLADLTEQINTMHSQLITTETLLADIAKINPSDLHPSRQLELTQDFENKINTLLSELESSSIQNKTLEDDLMHIRLNYVRERNNNLNLERILKETSKILAENEKAIEDHKTELNSKEEKIQSLLEAKTRLKKSLSEIHDKKIEELQSELNARKNLQEEIRTAIANYHEEQKHNHLLQQQLEALEDELQTQKKLAGQMDRLQNEYLSLQEYAHALEERTIALEAEKNGSEPAEDQREPR
jgi:chromosome segregation ATPase